MSTISVNENILKSTFSVGLDVCKSKIDICFLSSDTEKTIQISNTKKGISNFIEFLKENNFSTTVPLIIESTGDYDTLACILFSEAGLNIKEINPIITKKYVKHTIRWTKTDKTDARALANIWVMSGNELFTYNKSKKFIEVNKKIALVSNLEKQIQSLKMTIKSFNEVTSNLEIWVSVAIQNIEVTIQEFQENIKELQCEIENESLGEIDDKKIQLINSITGVSPYMAHVFYVIFAHKDFESKKSMYAFVWYDPRLRDSGTFIGKARISKRWNTYVRKKLFQAAFGAVRHCKLFQEIYERGKRQGKHHFVCIIAVIKKIVHIIYSLLKTNSMFNPSFGSF